MGYRRNIEDAVAAMRDGRDVDAIDHLTPRTGVGVGYLLVMLIRALQDGVITRDEARELWRIITRIADDILAGG